MSDPIEHTGTPTETRTGEAGVPDASNSPDGHASPPPSADAPEEASTPSTVQARRKPDKTHRHWGRRKRRLRRAAMILAVLAVLGTVSGVWIYRATRPEEYRPGEETEGITERLSRGLPEDAPEPRLVDVTDEAGLGGFVSFTGTRSSQLPEDMGSGLAWGDFDNDGDEDLFVVGAGGPLTADPSTWAESVLYANQLAETGKATFRRSDAFPELRIIGMGAAWADVDGDGWLDLAVSGYHALMLFHNDHGRLVPDQHFAETVQDFQDGYWAGLSWGDFDNDRDPDLYVTGYVRYQEDPNARDQLSQQYGHAVPYTLNPVSYDPERNLLFRNDGDGTFTEVGHDLGVDNPKGRSLGALWRDFDDDGRLDLYVANDVSDNAFYRNTSEKAGGSTRKAEGSTRRAEGSFQDIGLAAWVADYRGAMGLAAGDWNRDGDDDLFVTHWIAQENALYDNLLADVRPARPARPGTAEAATARTKGPGLPAGIGFSDRSAPLGLGQIALRFVGWGTELADLDGDGWLDLFVVDGSTFESPDDSTRLEPQVPMLLWNRHGEHFYDLAPLSPLLSQPHVGRGMAMADYDQDGDLDVAIVHLTSRGEGVQLLRNDMQTGHWIELRLKSRGPGGDLTGRGEGATVLAHAGDTLLRRSVTGASYLSQSTRTVHFGLGGATRLDTVQVHWLGGGTDSYDNLQAGMIWELQEGDPEPHALATPSPRSTAAPSDPASDGGADATTASEGADDDGRPPEADAPRGTSPAAAPNPGPDPETDAAHLTDRERLARFWHLERAGMDAIKTAHDPKKAESYFRQALALNPNHEDAHYYLAAALTAQGRTDEALEHLKRLTEIDPQSHRGFKRWGTLRALTARGPEDLDAAARALERSHELNKEETGSLLVLGEIDLLRGDLTRARQHLQWATTTNTRAAGGQFLLGYIDWKQGNIEAARQRLHQAREALGPDWTPQGTTSEGDTEETMHEEESPLGRFVRIWDGKADPDMAYAELDAFLAKQ